MIDSQIYSALLPLVFVGVTNTSQCTSNRWNRLIIAENVHRSYQESVKQERHPKVAMRVKASHSQKFACSYTYVFRHCTLWTGRANVIEHSRVCGAAVIVSISPRFFHTISGNWQFITGKQVRIRQYFVAAFHAAAGLHFTFSNHVIAA